MGRGLCSPFLVDSQQMVVMSDFLLLAVWLVRPVVRKFVASRMRLFLVRFLFRKLAYFGNKPFDRW